VGTTLANAWLHKEAVQTCELPLLAKVYALCLSVSDADGWLQRTRPCSADSAALDCCAGKQSGKCTRRPQSS